MVGFAIGLVIETVDAVLASVPNPVPSAGQLRIVRRNVRRTAAAGATKARKPVLAGIGAADWLIHQRPTFGLTAAALNAAASKVPASMSQRVVDELERPLPVRTTVRDWWHDGGPASNAS